MKHKIIEIKAKCSNKSKIRSILKNNKAKFCGEDHQIDTYFKVNEGRLKLRQGNIENYLIYYNRVAHEGLKKSDVILYKTKEVKKLKNVLTKSLGILTVVDKKREIYFIDNVKFHIDSVKNLGSFMEIEAIDKDDSFDYKKLQTQCQSYMKKFNLETKDVIKGSYSDLLIKKLGLS